MSYSLDYTHDALEDYNKLVEKGDKKYLTKLNRLIDEVVDHPRTGTGHPERLKGREEEVWSRRIDKKNRLVYIIYEETVLILVVSVSGHYSDK